MGQGGVTVPPLAPLLCGFRSDVDLRPVAHDPETVLAGDPFLQLLDLVATELDHLIRLDIDEMVVMFGTAGFVARPAVGEAVALDQPQRSSVLIVRQTVAMEIPGATLLTRR